MTLFRKRSAQFAMLGLLLALALTLLPQASQAASHREAPLISQDQTADISDFFMFRSYESGKEDRVVLLMDVVPGQDPSSGPNYWNFDPNVLYTFHIDNDANGKAGDLRFEIRFKTELRGINADLDLPLSYVALPPITALDGPGSEGLGLRQRYSVSVVDDGKSTVLGENLIAVPSNVGPRTMPDYSSLAAQGVYTLSNGMRVFAGQRDDPFYIDLGGTFDSLNLRRSPLPLLNVDEDSNDTKNSFGIDTLSRFNVSTIALEIPVRMLTHRGLSIERTPFPVIGAYAATSRRATTVLRTPSDNDNADRLRRSSGPWVQVQRLANPLVNELIIGTKDKDLWNALQPSSESRFLDYYLNPRLAVALQTVFNVPAGTSNRNDLRDLLLKYKPNDQQLSELLRLDLRVRPTPLAQQKRLGPLAIDAAGNPAPDPAAWPNGRRPIDDVTDIALRVVGGKNYIDGRAGDGVNVNDVSLPNAFPFLATPLNGRDSKGTVAP